MTEPVGPSPERAFDDLAHQLGHFVPVNKWFTSAEEKNVIVQVIRVYKDAFGSRPAFPTAILIQDFDELRVRAVFTRKNFLYKDAESKREFPTPDMDDLFVDVLMYILDIPSTLKTSAYLDGSVETFLPQGQ